MKYLSILLATCLILTLTACANPGTGDTPRVKCPACGYQFDVEQHG